MQALKEHIGEILAKERVSFACKIMLQTESDGVRKDSESIATAASYAEGRNASIARFRRSNSNGHILFSEAVLFTSHNREFRSL